MIHVQLFRSYDGGFVRVADKTALTEPEGIALIDAYLTAVLKGKHGKHRFEIHADHENEIGVFVGRFFTSLQFCYPSPTPVAKPA
jgi:hypothetical protein